MEGSAALSNKSYTQLIRQMSMSYSRVIRGISSLTDCHEAAYDLVLDMSNRLIPYSLIQRQTSVTAYLKSKQLLLLAFAGQISQPMFYLIPSPVWPHVPYITDDPIN